jgi:hypothetical protein
VHKEEDSSEWLSMRTMSGVSNNPFGKNSETRARGEKALDTEAPIAMVS